MKVHCRQDLVCVKQLVLISPIFFAFTFTDEVPSKWVTKNSTGDVHVSNTSKAEILWMLHCCFSDSEHCHEVSIDAL